LEPLCRLGVEVAAYDFAVRREGAQIMLARAISQAVLYSLVLVSVLSPAHALTQQELVAKLESAGYSQIRDIKSTAEGTAVKATKDGKEVSLVVDSSGQVKERK
jgi:Peptidase propeptide and YPEB domain